MSKVRSWLATLLVGMAALGASAAHAAGGPSLRMEPVPVDRLDEASLQRGARTFVNYCLNCHSAKYMRYNRLTDIGLTEAQIRDNLMFATDKIGDTMEVAMPAREARAWLGAPPPDLSVEARIRGRDWLYNYFLGFYRDETTPTGWNNLVFPNVGMPHVLWTQGGVNRLVETAYDTPEAAERAAFAASQLVAVVPGHEHKTIVRTLAQATPGALSPAEYRAVVADLVNYLDYMAEPARNKRINTGIVVLLFLGLMFLLAFLLKREYWKDVH